METRNIKFIELQVTASAEDRAALQKEMEEYTEQLTANPSDLSLIHISPVATVH